jgi:hypothetical protein
VTLIRFWAVLGGLDKLFALMCNLIRFLTLMVTLIRFLTMMGHFDKVFDKSFSIDG